MLFLDENKCIPNAIEFWFISLDGCGEIGINLNPYHHDGRWLMVDFGIIFEQNTDVDGEELTLSRTHVQMAAPQFIADRKDKLDSIIITHAHEDHVGGIPYLREKFQSPTIYNCIYSRNSSYKISGSRIK